MSLRLTPSSCSIERDTLVILLSFLADPSVYGSVLQYPLQKRIRQAHVASPANEFHYCVLIRVHTVAADRNHVSRRMRTIVEIVRIQKIHVVCWTSATTGLIAAV